MPYRTELKRPDLKGTFRCSLCYKIFCHSSSLSRHRMQAHFKSYTCTLCNKEITSNETLRAHMYKQHQISRMFMCRCCNWAFPDKTSLHIHMQAMASGNPGNVSIIAKSSASPNPPPNALKPPTTLVANGDNAKAVREEIPLSGLPPFPGFPPVGGIIPSGIFPAMPSREDLLQRIRERALLNGAAQVGMNNLAAWLTSSFPQVDASGVGNLGGTLHLNHEEENDTEDGNNNFKSSPDSVGEEHKMAELIVEGEGDGDESDSQMYEDTGETNGEDNGYAAEVGAKSSEQLRSSSTGDMEIHSEGSVENAEIGDQKLMSRSESPPKFGGTDLPVLRSAISASPLNSLLYKKKLNNALRNKAPENFFLNELSHLKEDFCNRSEGNGGPPTMVSSINNVSPSDTRSSGSHASPTGSQQIQFDQNCSSSSTGTGTSVCFDCQVLKGKLGLSENRNRFLEGKVTSLESKISRLESKVATMDSNTRRYETEGRNLREQNESLQRKLIDCQEKALSFLQKGGLNDMKATQTFLSEILQTSHLDASV